MKLSHRQLLNYINRDLSTEEVSEILTSVGLEVEEIMEFDSIKGGLKGFVIGAVMECEKHPDADRLSCTKVDIGQGRLFSIVCGAPNVAAGQKVVVATVGTMIYSDKGDFEIKKSKIRGVESEGMICAEDELGIGTSHDGILVLPQDAKVGQAAAEFFNVKSDTVYEVNLTPNRPDAACHIGSARDIVAYLAMNDNGVALNIPSIEQFKTSSVKSEFSVELKNIEACLRYNGLHLKNVKVGESPDWLKFFLQAIGLRPVNNVVDITNFVLHETGQPLHAFDATAIQGKCVVVKNALEGEAFVTLDGAEHKLSSTDLMICDVEKSLCIAGVFGGASSGVNEQTTEVFIESACFLPTSVRKTSKRLGIKTDSSFRFERGTDPNFTDFALKRAALLMMEICGAEIAGEIIDVYPQPQPMHEIRLELDYIKSVSGISVAPEVIEKIFKGLGIEILHSDENSFHVKVPLSKTDVKRPADLAEEIVRIYGYDKIELPGSIQYEINSASVSDTYLSYKKAAEVLSSVGFSEILTNSLSHSKFYKHHSPQAQEELVKVLNPISSELDVMRMDMLYSGLDVIAYNHNRKNFNLKLYELGKVYSINPSIGIQNENPLKPFTEREIFSFYLTGSEAAESWRNAPKDVDFYSMKSVIDLLIKKLKIKGEYKLQEASSFQFEYGTEIVYRKNVVIGKIGKVSEAQLKMFDIKKPVYYAELDWGMLLQMADKEIVKFKELQKFPTVRRDLALLIDKNVSYESLETTARKADNRILREVNLFDVYDGKNLPEGKKSYAMSFVFADDNATLTDEQIEPVMADLIQRFSKEFGATLR